MEADHARVLDHHVLDELLQPRVEFPTRLLGKMGDGHLQAPTEELRELRGEPDIVRGVGDLLELGGLDVGDPKLLEEAMELDPEVEDEGPEKGDGVDLAFADDKAGLASDLANRVGGKEAGEALLHRARLEGVGDGALPMVTEFGLGLPSSHPVGADGGA